MTGKVNAYVLLEMAKNHPRETLLAMAVLLITAVLLTYLSYMRSVLKVIRKSSDGFARRERMYTACTYASKAARTVGVLVFAFEAVIYAYILLG